MSTQVSNPYSFNITYNRSFSSPNIAANLPSNSTRLAVIHDKTYVTIPAGVKVIEVEIELSDPGNEGVSGDLYANDKRIAGLYTRDYNIGYTYVKVTSGKTYKMEFFLDSGASGYCVLNYSSSINSHSTSISADYD